MIVLGGERLKCIRFHKWYSRSVSIVVTRARPFNFAVSLFAPFLSASVAFDAQINCILSRNKIVCKISLFFSSHRRNYQLITVRIVLELRLLFLINARHYMAHYHHHRHHSPHSYSHYQFHRHRSGISHVRSVRSTMTQRFLFTWAILMCRTFIFKVNTTVDRRIKIYRILLLLIS